jgi:membrane protein
LQNEGTEFREKIMKKTFFDIISLIRKAANRFNENDPIMMAGALAFFTVFAIPPILIMIIYGIGLFSSQAVVSTQVFNQIELLMGDAGASILEDIVSNYIVADQNILQRLLTIGIFIFASSSFFIIIQHAINRIWNVKPKTDKNFKKMLKDRALSFGIILIMGVILVLSLGAETALASLRNTLNNFSPFITPFILNVLAIILSLLLGTLILGVIYKFLPDVIIEWKVVWVGAGTTSFLFILGKYIIGFALRSSNVQAMYGAAGSMAIFLLWVFYSSIILFYGAKVTQQYALSHAETIQPKAHAVKVEQREIHDD